MTPRKTWELEVRIRMREDDARKMHELMAANYPEHIYRSTYFLKLMREEYEKLPKLKAMAEADRKSFLRAAQEVDNGNGNRD